MLAHMESTAKQQAQRLYITVCWHDERSAAEKHGFTAYDKQFVSIMQKSLICPGVEA
jgi:valyl-tRNA synthetase